MMVGLGVLTSVCIVASLHVKDVAAVTSAPAGDGCAMIQGISNGVVSHCNLNTTLSCGENLRIALTITGCLLPTIIAFVSLIFILVLLVVLALLCYLVKKKSRRSTERTDASEPLLDHTTPTTHTQPIAVAHRKEKNNEMHSVVEDVDNNPLHLITHTQPIAMAHRKEKNNEMHSVVEDVDNNPLHLITPTQPITMAHRKKKSNEMHSFVEDVDNNPLHLTSESTHKSLPQTPSEVMTKSSHQSQKKSDSIQHNKGKKKPQAEGGIHTIMSHAPSEQEKTGDGRSRSESNLVRDKEREKELYKEKETLKKISTEMFEHKSFKSLPDLGSRLQKYWYKLQTRETGKSLQITVKMSKQCQLILKDPETVELLRNLFKHIQDLQHPCLYVIYDISYNADYIGILQSYFPKGSIRDHLFKTSPVKDWDSKYHANGGSQPFSKAEIAKCGHQILKAVEVLYDLGFSHIGQIHSGNVFIFQDNYVLGGYENSLLGYRTSRYQALNEAGLLDKPDVIMFGHLIYEMCTMQPLTDTIFPSNQDYMKIQDSELREVTRFIFETTAENGSHRELMEKSNSNYDHSSNFVEISKHSFFHSIAPLRKPQHVQPIELPPEVLQLLSKVFPSGLNLEAIIKRLGGKYVAEVPLSKLGWRHGKVWAKARNTVLEVDGLLTAMLVPHTCPIYVDTNINIIRKLLLLNHDFVFSIRDIDHIVLDDQHVIVIFQDMIKNGSLRDMIYQNPPTTIWASKYKTKGKKMEADVIASMGGQILQAMSYLSHLDGFDNPLTLGYVHTGNIFVQENICRLGGFENALLGFQTRRHNMFEDCSGDIDVLMFGHVIFEMSTGRELMMAIPTKKDYRDVPEALHPVLKYIFEVECAKIDKIMELLHFTPTSPSNITPLDGDITFFLEKVRKGKARNQDSQLGKGKHVFQAKFRKLRTFMPTLSSMDYNRLE